MNPLQKQKTDEDSCDTKSKIGSMIFMGTESILPANRPRALILNRSSNAGKGNRKWIKYLDSAYSKSIGLESLPLFETRESEGTTSIHESPSELVYWIENQISSGARNFVSVGGDGTTQLVLNALIIAEESMGLPKHSLKLGSIGSGSSNDFHKRLNKKKRDKKGINVPTRIQFDTAIPHDLIHISAKTQLATDIQFNALVNSSLGLVARGADLMNHPNSFIAFLKKRWVNFAVFIGGLIVIANQKNFNADVTVEVKEPDGKNERESFKNISLTSMTVLKYGNFAGSLRYHYEPEVNDGILGFFMAHSLNRFGLLRLLYRAQNGIFTESNQTHFRKVSSVHVRSNEHFLLEADGETLLVNDVKYTIEPKRFLVCNQ